MAETNISDGGGRALLAELVRLCSQLAHAAGRVIREVQALREDGTTATAIASATATLLGATLKDPTDSRTYLTLADVRAQSFIVGRLRERYPHINVVGEEDDDSVRANP